MDKKSIMLGIAGGILASMCCIGPLILFLLGFMSAASALAFTEYSQYFIIVALIFVSTGLWYRMRSKTCTLNSHQKLNQCGLAIGITIIAYVLLVYVALPSIINGASSGAKPVPINYVPEVGEDVPSNESVDGEIDVVENEEIERENVTNVTGEEVVGGIIKEEPNIEEPKAQEPKVVKVEEPEKIIEEEGPDVEGVKRPQKRNVLTRAYILFGGSNCASCVYLIDSTWARLDGVVTVSTDPEKYIAEVIFADWKISAEEIADTIKPRFSATILESDTCTVDPNFDVYCCEGKCNYFKNLKKIIG